MDISVPSNQKALAYLSARNPNASLTLLPEESERDPYMHLGSHPDIVERLWKEINAGLEADCRCGTNADGADQTGKGYKADDTKGSDQ